MLLDPQLLADTRTWLARAAEDLRAAKHAFSADPPLFSDIVFHCQQAVEKAFKGFLTFHQVPFRKTHSLEEISEQCLELDTSLKAIVDRAVPLTEYAWRFRYPDDLETPSPEETKEAFAIARDAYEAVLPRLPREARP